LNVQNHGCCRTFVSCKVTQDSTISHRMCQQTQCVCPLVSAKPIRSRGRLITCCKWEERLGNLKAVSPNLGIKGILLGHSWVFILEGRVITRGGEHILEHAKVAILLPLTSSVKDGGREHPRGSKFSVVMTL
jgi:hypothetical protein